MGITYNPFSLEGKTILVTGASSGIGRTTAIECSRLGAKVVITGRNKERLQETFDALLGDGHFQIDADLSNTADIDRLVDSIPAVNGCVNNAGYNVMLPVPFIKEEEMEKIFKVNTLAPIYLTKMLVKKKKILNEASIVFTSSIAALGVCSPANGLYSATKGAVSSFMKNAAIDLSQKKIRCNAVLPGMVETPLKAGKSLITEEQWEINRQLYPLKRFGKPEDVAYAIIYLLSDASSWVTGTELVVDGGRKLK